MGFKLRSPFVFEGKNINKYNKAFLQKFGIATASYDDNAITYIEKGYNINPIVYGAVNQIAVKTATIPHYIKQIEDKQTKNKRDSLLKSSNYNLSPQQEMKRVLYENKAFKDDYLEIPVERPNPLQTWDEFKALYSTFMSTTGNAYIYLMSPEDGGNKGVPIAWYLLPSHLIEINIKENAELLSSESPVDYYTLISGTQEVKFESEKVVHIKYSNPNFQSNSADFLYGFSPLRPVLKNIESSNELLNLNVKTHKNGGSFGFITGKGNGLMDEQAKAVKNRILEMDASKERMSNILASAQELQFTRISLTAQELKPFDYLAYDMQQISNALGWDDKLLGNDAGAKYDNYNLAMKKGITSKIMPDLKLLEQAINSKILPKYKGYENAYWEFDVSEVPEMQQDMVQLVGWAKEMLDRGVITRNEMRILTKFIASDDTNMDEYTVASDILTLEQSLDDLPTITND